MAPGTAIPEWPRRARKLSADGAEGTFWAVTSGQSGAAVASRICSAFIVSDRDSYSGDSS